jgi:3-isopropylmalate dehydrogenase
MKKRIAVIPGDGIGVDVTREAVKAIRCLGEILAVEFELKEYDYGAEKFLSTGITLPEGALEEFRTFDAVFMGAFGDPRVPDMRHAADILLGTRFGLDLYVNQRPVKLLSESLCPLKGRRKEDVDMVVFRENTEGLYVGMGGFFKKGTADEIATQVDVNTRKGVERIIRHAFQYAKERGLGRVCMSDKSNVLTYGHDLWQRVFAEVSGEYSEIEARHLYVDALTMQMVKDPSQFEVIVTCNMFGDIVTDLGAQLQGGLGMAASGNVHPGSAAMFEPVHGSAPKYAGKDVANPMGAILTVQLMMEHMGMARAGDLIEKAAIDIIERKRVTRDLGGDLGTAATGDALCESIIRLAA